MKFTPVFDFKHPDLKKYIKLTLPLMFGLTMFFSMEVFKLFFGSYLPSGSIADLEYGLRTMMLLVAFFGQAVGVASYPFMARLATENKLQEMNQLLNNTLRYLSLVIPFSVLLMVLRYEIVLILFQRGKFDATATEHLAVVLIFLLVGAFALTANTIVPRAFYATQDTLFPAIYGTIAVLLSLPLYMIGLQIMGTNGVALAISLSCILQVTILYVLWNKRSNNAGSRSVYSFYAKMMGIASLIGILLTWFRSVVLNWIDPSTLLGSLMMSALISSVFIIILLGAGYGLGIKEITELANRLVKKIY
jgi:putative peptidoglycan lipid II flippase